MQGDYWWLQKRLKEVSLLIRSLIKSFVITLNHWFLLNDFFSLSLKSSSIFSNFTRLLRNIEVPTWLPKLNVASNPTLSWFLTPNICELWFCFQLFFFINGTVDEWRNKETRGDNSKVLKATQLKLDMFTRRCLKRWRRSRMYELMTF